MIGIQYTITNFKDLTPRGPTGLIGLWHCVSHTPHSPNDIANHVSSGLGFIVLSHADIMRQSGWTIRLEQWLIRSNITHLKPSRRSALRYGQSGPWQYSLPSSCWWADTSRGG